MRIKLWRDVDFVETEVPDDLLRPLVERLVTTKDWDRNLDRVGFMIRDTKLNIADWLLQADQRAKRELAEAHAIVDRAETVADAPDAAAVWDAGTT